MDTRDQSNDELALARYRYLLRTAPPETLEAVHREAFERLTPDQRRQVLDGLAREADPAEIRAASESPDDLARLATRSELQHPGTMERAFGGPQAGGWGSGGGLFGGNFLGMLAGAFVGTSLANMLLPMGASAAELDSGSLDGGGGDAAAADTGDAGGDDQGDAGADTGDWGGDAGGMDDLGGFGDGGFDVGF